jgi:hypothetical protein
MSAIFYCYQEIIYFSNVTFSLAMFLLFRSYSISFILRVLYCKIKGRHVFNFAPYSLRPQLQSSSVF